MEKFVFLGGGPRVTAGDDRREGEGATRPRRRDTPAPGAGVRGPPRAGPRRIDVARTTDRYRGRVDSTNRMVPGGDPGRPDVHAGPAQPVHATVSGAPRRDPRRASRGRGTYDGGSLQGRWSPAGLRADHGPPKPGGGELAAERGSLGPPPLGLGRERVDGSTQAVRSGSSLAACGMCTRAPRTSAPTGLRSAASCAQAAAS